MKNLMLLTIITMLITGTYSCSSTGSEEKSTSISNASIITTDNTIMEETKTIETVTNGKVVHLTTQEFKDKVFNYEVNKEWKYLGNKPAIIDFYADWCRPCKMVAPILDDLAKEYENDIVIYKVDTEAEQELAAVFGIRSIPSILFIPVEGQPQMAQGALPKESFKDAIRDILLK
ncbi:MAG: thioredoxin [Chloroflexia bacterium]|nr:thioredoxin [Chloroflexia bacterium]